MSDQDRGPRCSGVLGAPADARNGLTIHSKVETLLNDAFLCLLAENFHDRYLTVPNGTAAHTATIKADVETD
jgi:hypothetical protein